MDQLRNIWATVRKQLGALTPSQKLLIGSLGVIVLMTLFLVTQYAGGGRTVELLPGVETAHQQRAARFLDSRGIDHELRDGRIYIAEPRRSAALAMLSEAQELPDDTTILFGNLIERQSWTNSRQQNDQLFLIALQNELSRQISQWRGIRDARVLLDVPEPHGLGAAVRQPTASVTIFSDSGAAIRQETVDAIAHAVAGARAGLEVDKVRVIDGVNGRQRSATREDDLLATTYLEHAQLVENQTREKLNGLLSYIPGVIVAVTAEVDVTRRSAQERRHFSAEEGGTVSLLRREVTSSLTEGEGIAAAEPGVRSNQSADIYRGGGGQRGMEQEEIEAEMENFVGSRVEQINDPRGMPTRLAASVNIPRGYIVRLLGGNGEEGDDPSEEQILERFEREKGMIEQSIRPHLRTRTGEGEEFTGEVFVSLIPGDDAPVGPQQAGLLGGTDGGGVLGVGEGLIERGVLVGLALVSLVMMVMMVRRAAKRDEMPSAEELVGIPPPLETASDLIGEADESDTPMAGIEVGEDRLRTQKMLEQVSDLIEQNPKQSAMLLNRWMAIDE